MSFQPAASSFDSVLNTAATGGAGDNTKSSPADTNQQGSQDLLKGLMTALSKNQGDTPANDAADTVDYSALFAPEKPASSPAPAKNTQAASSGSDTNSGDTPATSSNANTVQNNAGNTTQPNAFITQLNDEALMSKWVAAQQVAPIQLSEDALKAYQDEHGDINLTPETLTGVMTQAANVALQQSAQQTISFLRELIPALTETAEAKALSSFTTKQNKQQIIKAFEGNEPLQLLADNLVKNGQAADPDAAVKMINQLMHDINLKQNSKLNAQNPKVDKSISTFLQSVN